MEEPGGERRHVAILIADIAESTEIGERLGPERSKFLFDEVVRLMSEQVERFGGTVAQLTGDGLFAVSPPSPHGRTRRRSGHPLWNRWRPRSRRAQTARSTSQS